jgi:uncharacterized protein (DUF362 family)
MIHDWGTPPRLPVAKGIRARVAAIRGHDLIRMTRQALEAIGGIGTVVHEGESVFIKPNFVTFPWARTNNCFRGGECTKPEIIITVVEECLKAGARKVVVGEGSHLPSFDWDQAVTLDRSTSLSREVAALNLKYKGKATLACLENDSPSWNMVPSSSPLGEIAISSLAADADRVITIPVAKTHSWAQLTLGTKNFIGITPLSRYAQLINNTWWNRGSFDHRTPGSISRVFLDITRDLRPDLSIIDFSIGMEGNGPTRDNGGTTVDMEKRIGSWVLLASKDIMAADATAARIMDHPVEKIAQLNMGFEMGLGEIREEAIEIIGEKTANLQSHWKAARLMG